MIQTLYQHIATILMTSSIEKQETLWYGVCHIEKIINITGLDCKIISIILTKCFLNNKVHWLIKLNF